MFDFVFLIYYIKKIHYLHCYQLPHSSGYTRVLKDILKDCEKNADFLNVWKISSDTIIYCSVIQCKNSNLFNLIMVRRNRKNSKLDWLSVGFLRLSRFLKGTTDIQGDSISTPTTVTYTFDKKINTNFQLSK